VKQKLTKREEREYFFEKWFKNNNNEKMKILLKHTHKMNGDEDVGE
jgi:hypothetical protein